MSVEFKGDIEFRKKLDKAAKGIEKNVHRGMIAGGDMLKRKSVQEAPVEFGTLRQSAYKQVFKRLSEIELYIGYYAKYAPWVHEAPMKLKGQERKGSQHKGRYWDGGRNKFLERPVRKNIDKFLKTVQAMARIK